MHANADPQDEPPAADASQHVDVQAVIAALWADYARLSALHRTELEDVRSAKNRQIDRLRDDLAGRPSQEALDEARQNIRDLERRLAARRAELDGVYASETWRIGKALAFIPRRVYLWLTRRTGRS